MDVDCGRWDIGQACAEYEEKIIIHFRVIW